MAVRGEDAGGAALGDGREQGRPVGVVREHEPAIERALPPTPRTRIRPEAKASEWIAEPAHPRRAAGRERRQHELARELASLWAAR